MGQTVHVVPVNDLIEHLDDNCPCGPDVEHVPTDTGDGWLIVHHSLDGRESHEQPPNPDDASNGWEP